MVRAAHPSHPKIGRLMVKWLVGVVIYATEIPAIITTRRTVAVSRKILTGRRGAGKEFMKRIFWFGKVLRNELLQGTLVASGHHAIFGQSEHAGQMLSSPFVKAENLSPCRLLW